MSSVPLLYGKEPYIRPSMHHVEFAKSVKIDDCRIINRPDLVFLCGGKTLNPRAQYLSARDYFWHHVKVENEPLHKRFRLAENVNDWFDHDLFSDLLEVEEYLADLAELIILFVESPGSIAELGFRRTPFQDTCCHQSIPRHRTIVYCRRSHPPDCQYDREFSDVLYLGPKRHKWRCRDKRLYGSNEGNKQCP